MKSMDTLDFGVTVDRQTRQSFTFQAPVGTCRSLSPSAFETHILSGNPNMQANSTAPFDGDQDFDSRIEGRRYLWT